jgi:hypothetical protein
MLSNCLPNKKSDQQTAVVRSGTPCYNRVSLKTGPGLLVASYARELSRDHEGRYAG